MNENKTQINELIKISKRRNRKRNTYPSIAMAGPVTVWMFIFIMVPFVYVIFLSFMG